MGVALGNFVYTTPNETYIPCPVLGFRRVAVREDYRYGPDDYTLWPQPYSDTFPHLGAIPRQPDDPSDPLQAMWYNPLDSDFKPTNHGGIAVGLGKLDPVLLDQKFRPLLDALKSRFSHYISSIPADSPHRKFAAVIQQALFYTFNRLQSFVTTWRNIRFTVVELQRYYLELLGLLDYMEVYKPRMDGIQPPSSTVTNTIGVFASKPRIVEEFMSAGLPVWYIRPLLPGFGNNVLSVVEPRQYFGHLTTKVHSAFPALHASDSHISTGQVVGLIHQFSRKWISTPDPFHGAPTTSLSTPSSSASQKQPQPSSSPFRATPQPPRKKLKPNGFKSVTQVPSSESTCCFLCYHLSNVHFSTNAEPAQQV